jgi:hypothetical protein
VDKCKPLDQALVGAAAGTAGDAAAAARALTKAVHLSPADASLRGKLARVLPAVSAATAASAARLVGAYTRPLPPST